MEAGLTIRTLHCVMWKRWWHRGQISLMWEESLQDPVIRRSLYRRRSRVWPGSLRRWKHALMFRSRLIPTRHRSWMRHLRREQILPMISGDCVMISFLHRMGRHLSGNVARWLRSLQSMMCRSAWCTIARKQYIRIFWRKWRRIFPTVLRSVRTRGLTAHRWSLIRVLDLQRIMSRIWRSLPIWKIFRTSTCRFCWLLPASQWLVLP